MFHEMCVITSTIKNINLIFHGFWFLERLRHQTLINIIYMKLSFKTLEYITKKLIDKICRSVSFLLVVEVFL